VIRSQSRGSTEGEEHWVCFKERNKFNRMRDGEQVRLISMDSETESAKRERGLTQRGKRDNRGKTLSDAEVERLRLKKGKNLSLPPRKERRAKGSPREHVLRKEYRRKKRPSKIIYIQDEEKGILV